MIGYRAEIPYSHGTNLLELYYSHADFGYRGLREHRHTAFEISCIKEGSGVYVAGGKKYDIACGDLFFYSTNEPHCITEIKSPEGMTLMNIKFEPRFIWSGGSDMFDSKFLRIFLERNEHFENRLDRANPACAQIRELMLKIEEEFKNARPEYELMVKIYLLTTLAIANRSFGYVRDSARPVKLMGRQLSQIEMSMDYINEHYCGDVSLEEIASSINMSKNYFSALFKKLNGMSPWDYITLKRIDRACDRLKNTSDVIIDIACDCGFNSTANFNRAFKKVTGISPSEYRTYAENNAPDKPRYS